MEVTAAIYFDVDDVQFNARVGPFLSHLNSHGILFRVNGNMFVEDVEKEILEILRARPKKQAKQLEPGKSDDTQFNSGIRELYLYFTPLSQRYRRLIANLKSILINF
jgi:hypothetical protein